MENVEQSKRSLGSTLVLALGTFAVGMDAFIVSAFLPEMAEDLSVSASMAGWSVTAFALAYALLAPIIATMTSTVARRRLLVSSLVLLGLANIASAACTTLGLLILTRIAAAASAAAYTPNAGATAAAMVHPGQRARALSVVIGGLTVATALGVPLGHAISVFMNWRASLAFVGVLAFAAAATVFFVMKPMPGGAAIGLRQRLSVLARPGVVGILMLTVFGMAAAYSAYAFVISILEGFQIPPANFTMMLFMYGLGAFCGNYLSGWATDRHGPIMTLACAYLVMTLALGGLGLMSGGKGLEAIYPISFLIACWGGQQLGPVTRTAAKADQPGSTGSQPGHCAELFGNLYRDRYRDNDRRPADWPGRFVSVMGRGGTGCNCDVLHHDVWKYRAPRLRSRIELGSRAAPGRAPGT